LPFRSALNARKIGVYVKNPIINLRNMNFKFQCVGRLTAGTYTVDLERITLIEALGKVSDLNRFTARGDGYLITEKLTGLNQAKPCG
jgi:polysaccharide export outer membrane protein